MKKILAMIVALIMVMSFAAIAEEEITDSVCDVYVFSTPRGEMMIPALRRVVRSVDVEAGTIVLDEAALDEVAVWEDEPAERDE